MTTRTIAMKRARRTALRGRFGIGASLLVYAATGCGYTPARFSASEPVTLVHDDYPVPKPERNTLPDEIRYGEAYVENAVVDAFDPRRTPDSRDVNSLDEVPTSSWFAGRRYANYDDFYKDGPPSFPLTEVAHKSSLPTGYRVFVDHAGRRWEIVSDEPHRSGMKPAAGVIASRLLSALGYYVAESYPVKVDGERVLAIRFPAARGAVSDRDAADLGPTTSLGTRIDDLNDVVDHEHRRTLRALGLVAAWIGLDEIRPWALRDVYVGVPDVGFVQHQVVGLEDALGAGRLVSALHDTDRDRPPSNPWLAFGTFGFYPKERATQASTPTGSVGLFPAQVAVASYHFSVPFPASLQAKPADLYWIGKRISAITHSRIEEAVSAGELEPESSEYLEKHLLARRDEVAKYAMSLVTPLDVTEVEPFDKNAPVKIRKDGLARRASFAVELDDVAIRRGFARAATSHYEVDIYDERGSRIQKTETVTPRGSVVRVRVPGELLDKRGYVIVRIKAYRDGTAAPRPVEVHLRGDSTRPLIRGIRH